MDGDKIINEVTEGDTTLSSSDWSNVLKINNVGQYNGGEKSPPF
jgi:hypothetical protein